MITKVKLMSIWNEVIVHSFEVLSTFFIKELRKKAENLSNLAEIPMKLL
jgi:hypothetical protein